MGQTWIYKEKQNRSSMKTKHIKMFESFSSENYEQEIANSIFENWKENNLVRLSFLFEQDFWDEEENLSAGEKRALDRDFQILGKEQMAVLYLRALGAEEGDPGKYLMSIKGLRDFGAIDDNTGAFGITIPALADAIGLESSRTVSRTTNKFRNLISGVGETAGETIYPKILKAFEFFNTETPTNLSVVASSIIQDPAMSTRNRDAAEVEKETASGKRAEKIKRDLRIGEMVFLLFKDLKKNPAFNDSNKAERVALNKIAGELAMDVLKVKMAYDKFKASKGI
jgi:hypothetical protein